MSSIVIAGDTSGTVTLQAPAIAGTTTLNLPATSGTVITGSGGVVGIAAGGTNNGSLAVTAGGTLYTDGSKVVNVGAGSAGQLLQSNGSSAPTWVAPPAGGFGNMEVFTSSGTFTVPSGITKVKVTVVGGGGNGGNATYGPNASASGGGGGGGAAIEVISGLTPGNTVSVTVGGAGGTSSFGAYCSATGGAASPNVTSGTLGNGGAGGTGSGGDINFTGSRGNGALALSVGAGASGGSSLLAGNQQKDSSVAAGQSGLNYGGGGTGAYKNAPVGTSPGGAGAGGIVIVEY